MKIVKVKMKNGKVLSGPMWTWRPKEGWFEIAGEDFGVIKLEDVDSAIEYGVQTSHSVIEDVDLLQKARQQGWLT